jgi:hypothetical protein
MLPQALLEAMEQQEVSVANPVAGNPSSRHEHFNISSQCIRCSMLPQALLEAMEQQEVSVAKAAWLASGHGATARACGYDLCISHH